MEEAIIIKVESMVQNFKTRLAKNMSFVKEEELRTGELLSLVALG